MVRPWLGSVRFEGERRRLRQPHAPGHIFVSTEATLHFPFYAKFPFSAFFLIIYLISFVGELILF
jgi:hypothetical protein